MNKNLRNLVCVILISTFTTQVTYANSSSLQNKKNSINEQIENANAEIKEKKENKVAIAAELEKASAEAQKALEELNAINAQVQAVQVELSEAKEEYKIATEKKDKQYEALKKRMRFMYEYGDTGYMQVLLESSNFSDFFKRVEYINTIIRYDKNLLGKLEETQLKIDEQVNLISKKKSEIDTLQAQQKSKTQELQAKEAAKESALSKVNADIQAQQDIVFSLEKENAKIEAMIKEAERKAANSGKTLSYAGGSFIWPVPSNYTYISSGYVHRNNPVSGRPEYHSGYDIPAPKGTSVFAAADGVVITSGWVNGYGNTVMISHGSGLVTLYGHNSSLNVSVGQSVSKGDVIAGVGTTGNSTGNHCHFEVRLNGKHTSPAPYLGR